MTFVLGDFKLPFTVENFLMSFSIPNLHFHATTAYDIPALEGRAGQQTRLYGVDAHQEVTDTSASRRSVQRLDASRQRL